MGFRDVGRAVHFRLHNQGNRFDLPYPVGPINARKQTENQKDLARYANLIAGRPGALQEVRESLQAHRMAWCKDEALAYTLTWASGPSQLIYALETGHAQDPRAEELVPEILGWFGDLVKVVRVMTHRGNFHPLGCRTLPDNRIHHDSEHVLTLAEILEGRRFFPERSKTWSRRFDRLENAAHPIRVEIDDAVIYTVSKSKTLRGCVGSSVNTSSVLPRLQEELKVWKRPDLVALYSKELKCGRDRNRKGVSSTSHYLRVSDTIVYRDPNIRNDLTPPRPPDFVFPAALTKDRPYTKVKRTGIIKQEKPNNNSSDKDSDDENKSNSRQDDLESNLKRFLANNRRTLKKVGGPKGAEIGYRAAWEDRNDNN